jgi:hypothetical protein
MNGAWMSIRVAEPEIVLEEVAVAVHMSHHQLLIGELVAVHQVRVAGIVVDHQLVNLLQAVDVPLRQLLVFHSPPPVRVARGKTAVGGNGVQLFVVDEFEHRGKEVEPVVPGVLLHLALDIDQLGRQ